MAEVQPLRGLRYSRAFIDDLSQVITPPYDVIDEKAQERYYERHPYNIIRLELGKTLPGDDTLNNVYTRAAATFSEWRLQEIIKQESRSCYYLYRQRFSYGGKAYTRTSLLARVRLEPWDARVVLPHENTMTKAKEDRLQLLRACAANLSPIICLYDDPQRRITGLLNRYADEAEIQIKDEVGEEHRLHPISDPQQIALIHDFFSQRQLHIADGHHRYTTALSYQQEILAQRKELNQEDGINFMLMALIDVEDPGMLVLPTHRLLNNLSQEALRKLSQEQLSRHFSVQFLDQGLPQDTVLQVLHKAGQERASLVILHPDQTLLVSINEQGQHAMEQSGHTAAWNVLDVAIAQHLVLESILGLSAEDMIAGTHVRYTHDSTEAFHSVRSGASQAALILNATPLRQVCDVAQADDRMPQKSTYFYPKLTTGLVINPLW